MPYRLVVDKNIINTKENRYIDIDFLEKKVYSLQEINKFTTNFEDAEELIYFLIERNIISVDMADLPIKIINAKNNRISFEPFFESNRQYLDLNYIINYFQSNCTNSALIGKIYYSFGKKTDKYTNSEDVHRELGNYYNCLKKGIFYDEYDNRSIYTIIDEYLKKLCKNNPVNVQKIASFIVQNERNNLITEDKAKYEERLEHIEYLLKNDNLLEEEKEFLLKEYDHLNELLSTKEERKW